MTTSRTSTASSGRWTTSAPRRSRTWPRSSRPTTRPTTPSSRSSATSTPRSTLEKVAEVFRGAPVTAGAAAGRHDGAAADRRAAYDHRGRAGAPAPARHGLQDSGRPARPTPTRSRCWRPSCPAAGARAYTNRSSGKSSCRAASAHSRPCRAARACSSSVAPPPGQDAGGTRSRRSRKRSRRSRPRRSPTGSCRRHVTPPAPISSAGSASSLNRAIQLSEDALAFDDPGRINTRAAAIAKVTAADVQRVAKQYLVKTNRTVVVTTPKAAAPKGVQ